MHGFGGVKYRSGELILDARLRLQDKSTAVGWVHVVGVI